MQRKLTVVYAAAEMNPYAKTGGLADVAGALPSALFKKGAEVIPIMPLYGMIDARLEYVTDFPVIMGGRIETCVIRKDSAREPIVYFVDNHQLFGRPGIYGYHDDGLRYAFFCKAILGFLMKTGIRPDILNLNDWHTGPVAMLLRHNPDYREFFASTKVVFSIHNLRYQGLFGKEMTGILGVNENVFTPDGAEYYGYFNFLKSGISYSDQIMTVSSTYAKEILTPEYGEGLDGHLLERQNRLTGIVNGIDTDDFDPADPDDIFVPYTVETIGLKKENKKRLMQILELVDADAPLIGIVSRLDGQKGLALAADSIESLILSGTKLSLAVLGTGDPYLENRFRELAAAYPRNVSVRIAFDPLLAKQIYAGADIFLMPSRFEPCGLGQLIAMRYGTIPVVRETGGLKDTVTDVRKSMTSGTGFLFRDMNADELTKVISEAAGFYRTKHWEKLCVRAMKTDNSWNHSATKYLELYDEMRKENG